MISAFLVDIGNLYHSVHNKFEDQNLDFQKLLGKANEYGEVKRAIAYGTQAGNQAASFIACLRNLGYEVRYKRHQMALETRQVIRKAVWDVGMTVDMIRLAKKYHTLILASSDTDLIPGLEYIRNEGVRVICMGCDIPGDIRDVVDTCYEINEELLQVKE